MPFRPPSKILEKTLRFKALNHKEGRLYLWGHAALINPLISQAYYVRLLEKMCGKHAVHHAQYLAGKAQAMKGLEIINQRFGYAKTISDKKRLFDFNAGQAEILGFGTYRWTLDTKNMYFTGTTSSPFAEDYRKLWGLQKQPVDYWFMGAWVGCAEAIFEEPMVCLEARCIAKGERVCQFIVQPTPRWKRSDPLVKQHRILFSPPLSMKELASQR